MANEDFAIVIGISRYPKLKDLEGPVKDAEDFKDWLVNLAEVPDANIKKVVSDNPPKPGNRPILNEIDDAFDELFSAASQIQARRLYIYFAGHGCAAESNHVALIMANATMETLNNSLNTSTYHEGLVRRALFPEQIIFYDCCRNYDSRVRGRDPYWTTNDPVPGTPDVTQFILYAAAFTQYANERVLDYSDRRGLFTKALLEGLRGQAAKRIAGDWYVTTESLPLYVQTRLQQLIEENQLNLRQTVARGAGRIKELILAKVAPQLQQVSVKTNGVAGELVVKNGKLKEIMRLPIAAGTVQLQLAPGRYVLSVEPGNLGEIVEVPEGVPTAVTLGGL